MQGMGSDLPTLSIPFSSLPVRTRSQDSTRLFGTQLGCSQGQWGSPKGDSDPQGHLAQRLGGEQGPAGSAIGELSQQSCWTCLLCPNGSR